MTLGTNDSTSTGSSPVDPIPRWLWYKVKGQSKEVKPIVKETGDSKLSDKTIASDDLSFEYEEGVSEPNTIEKCNKIK